ncbi:MAG: MFS transporter [Gammaproteobacteria bacterium]
MIKRAILGWCFFEAANSAFFPIILTLIFAPFFTQHIAANPTTGAAQWGMAVALASFIIALLGPLIAVVADLEGRRKPWLGFFTLLTGLSAIFLWGINPNHTNINIVLACLILGVIGTEIANIFHGAMLRDLAPWNKIAFVSGWSRSLGYVGQLISLLIALIFIIQVTTSFLPVTFTESDRVRICCLFVAIWICIFSLPLFLFTQDHAATELGLRTAARNGLHSFFFILRDTLKSRSICWLLLANMAFVDGINTLNILGGIYLSHTFNLSIAQIIYFGMAVSIIEAIGAFSLGYLDIHLGSKNIFFIVALIVGILASIMLLLNSYFWFFLLALIASFFIGLALGATRSLLAQIAPEEKMVQVFSLYALSGKATAFLGPLLASSIMLMFSSQRLGLIIVPIFLFLSALSIRLM